MPWDGGDVRFEYGDRESAKLLVRLDAAARRELLAEPRVLTLVVDGELLAEWPVA